MQKYDPLISEKSLLYSTITIYGTQESKIINEIFGMT